ncbi:hypothetical protein FQA39_LY13268 [Lamprigera yunnana]|nr:hypothetical protein FQA39_LY13268 [Lamprigera yunnana]
MMKLTQHKFFLLDTFNILIVICFILDSVNISYGITTIHYDKPKLHQGISTTQSRQTGFLNITVAERQKRLLPYINFYVSQNLQQNQQENYSNDDHYQLIGLKNVKNESPAQKFSELLEMTYQPNKIYENPNTSQTKFTPFLETNALPGPFVPMIRPGLQKITVAYVPPRQSENIPNFSAIYDKLSQMKLRENTFETEYHYPTSKNKIQFIRKKPENNYVPLQSVQATSAPSNTFVHTYTPTSIEIPNQEINYAQQLYDNQNLILTQNVDKQLVSHSPSNTIPINIPGSVLNTQIVRLNTKQNYFPIITISPQIQHPIQEQKQYLKQNHQQYLQEITPTTKSNIFTPPIESRPIFVSNPVKLKNPEFITLQETPAYPSEELSLKTVPNHIQVTTSVENENLNSPNSLSQILKNLQDSNILPHTLTPQNIDNSIKTLINILNTFKKDHKFTHPIVVADAEAGLHKDVIHTTNLENSNSADSITEIFPANTPEGGTPGKPGIDYPILTHIPPTNFDCQTQRYKGFFADPATNCQVWHYCDLNGGQASFLCPNGTIFSQVALTCDWWFNVKCSTTTQLYVLNERLYKYIIPLKPKFPEDYSGPLVDRYLALKFKEMEEKLKKEKEEKQKEDSKTDEVDELQLLEDQTKQSLSHTTEHFSNHK